MTTQQSLDRIWAETGGVTDPGAVKYSLGWVSEIPTFENFNYVLQSATINLLKLAERGEFDWDATIEYFPGGRVMVAEKVYYCHTTNTGQNPSTDTLYNYWSPGPQLGTAPSAAGAKLGMWLNAVGANSGSNAWTANDMTVTSAAPGMALNTTGASDNLIVKNVSGNAVVVNVGNVAAPTGASHAIGQAGVHKIYHEGNKPVQADVADTIPEEPQDGKLYARRDGSWIEVTATTISASPPSPVNGAGQGWYNLNDGILYVDINDGTSSQWVPASPARAPAADTIPYDNLASGLTATTMQAAIDELAALHP